MSTNHDTKDSGCCGGSAKSTPKAAQQPVTQAAVPDAKAQESETSPPPPKPTTPQPKSKSCCG